MPSLGMRAPAGSLLEQTNRLIVQRQISYGAELDVPWGISESGYNRMNVNSNYEYRAFGAPGLGLKRGLEEDSVIAPYATALALMEEKKITSLMVVDGGGKLEGIVHLHDLWSTELV